MTSATIFNPNNCDHEQLFKASGRVEANIATTVTKDNICASGKEGIKGNDQTDNSTSLCKPEDLTLALAHIENKLARAWLHKFDGEKKFPLIQLQRCLNIMCPITTMDMLRLIASYSWICLEPKISRLTGHKSLTAMPCRTTTGPATSLLMEMRKSPLHVPCGS